MLHKIVSCDIDGILNNYPECWLDYLADRCGVRYGSIKEAKDQQPLYKEYKIDYRRSEWKANLPTNDQGVKMVRKLDQMGYEIIMATSRPLQNPMYPQLYKLTYDWLKKNDIPFSALRYKDSEVSYIDDYPGIEFHIEDDLKYAEPLAQKGIPVYLYTKHLKNQYNGSQQNIMPITLLEDIFSYVKK